MIIPDKLPSDLKESAVNLSDAGINGFAWHIDEAYKVIDWLEGNCDSVVLGGDIYLFIKRKDVVYPLRENWSYDPAKADSSHSVSMKVARDFLERYDNSPLRSDLIVDLVLSPNDSPSS